MLYHILFAIHFHCDIAILVNHLALILVHGVLIWSTCPVRASFEQGIKCWLALQTDFVEQVFARVFNIL